MVKFKFCPACGAIDMHVQPDGNEKCNSCQYSGVAMEGAPDKLNEYRKKLKGGYTPTSAVTPTEQGKASANPLIGYTTDQPPKGGLKPKKVAAKSTDDFEIY
jgi:DNA-directed RNA polymerase subunit M/transcription elongation factor TFIIS